MKINRAEILQKLEAVLPGLSETDVIEQSSCFIFTGKEVLTFNDEVACYTKFATPFKGAVKAAPLVSILKKRNEAEIEVAIKDDQLILKGKGRMSKVNMEQEILLPVDCITRTNKWKPLPESFAAALSDVCQCTGTDESQFALTCVHLSTDYIEACDNFQACRCTMELPIRKPVLLRAGSVQSISQFAMTHFSETKEWFHFKNKDGLILSCRRFVQSYPDLSGILSMKGTEITFPKNMAEAIDCAEVFTSESDDKLVNVLIKDGKLTIKGTGPSGEHKEIRRVKFAKNIQFNIAPKLLLNLFGKYNTCSLTKDKLKVQVDDMTYVTVLG